MNDCTSDCSMEVLYVMIEKYPNRKSHITVIVNETNRRLAYCRNIRCRTCAWRLCNAR